MRWNLAMLALAGAHGVLALGCLLWLRSDAALIDGVHPALKPLRFAGSLAILLASVALVLRVLVAPAGLRGAIGGVLSATMVIEIVVILAQALRGRASHYNTSTPLDALLWRVMAIAILVALLCLAVLAVVATLKPLACAPLLAAAIRIGLWLVLLVAVSGFAMVARSSHGTGAVDLRTPHFFALHGLQVLPALAWLLLQLPASPAARWTALLAGALLWAATAVGTLVHALR